MRKTPFLSITLPSWNTEFPPPSFPPLSLSATSDPHPSTDSVTDCLCAPKSPEHTLIAALSPGIIIASRCFSPSLFRLLSLPWSGAGRGRACGRTLHLCLLPQVCPALGLVLGGTFRNQETHCCLQGPGLCVRFRQLLIKQGRDCTVTSEISLRL